jgi:uncharacterized membrane protein
MLFAACKEKLPMMQQDIPAGKPATNIGDGQRVLSAITGSLLLYFVSKKHKADSLLLLGGGYLLYRAVSGHCPLSSVFKGKGPSGQGSNINVRSEIVVNRPRSEVYTFWRNLENLPLFMKHLDHVDEIDSRTFAWKLKMPAGFGDIRWEAKVIKDEKDRELSWHSVPGAAIENTGKINFSDTPGNATRIGVMLSYRAPLGVIGERIGRLLTPVFKEKIESDLNSFKQFIENASLAGN